MRGSSTDGDIRSRRQSKPANPALRPFRSSVTLIDGSHGQQLDPSGGADRHPLGHELASRQDHAHGNPTAHDPGDRFSLSGVDALGNCRIKGAGFAAGEAGSWAHDPDRVVFGFRLQRSDKLWPAGNRDLQSGDHRLYDAGHDSHSRGCLPEGASGWSPHPRPHDGDDGADSPSVGKPCRLDIGPAGTGHHAARRPFLVNRQCFPESARLEPAASGAHHLVFRIFEPSRLAVSVSVRTALGAVLAIDACSSVHGLSCARTDGRLLPALDHRPQQASGNNRLDRNPDRADHRRFIVDHHSWRSTDLGKNGSPVAGCDVDRGDIDPEERSQHLTPKTWAHTVDPGHVSRHQMTWPRHRTC